MMHHSTATVFNLLDEMATRTSTGAKRLRGLLVNAPHEPRLNELRTLAHGSAALNLQLTYSLAHTSIPAAQVEMTCRLAAELSRILHALEKLAEGLQIYHAAVLAPELRQQLDMLVDCLQLIDGAVHGLRKSLSPMLGDVRRLQQAAEASHRDALARLFSGSYGPMEVLESEDLYNLAGEAIRLCGQATDTLERISH